MRCTLGMWQLDQRGCLKTEGRIDNEKVFHSFERELLDYRTGWPILFVIKTVESARD